MKAILIFTVILMMAYASFCQVNVSDSVPAVDTTALLKSAQKEDQSPRGKRDTTRLVLGKKKIMIVKDEDGKDYVTIEDQEGKSDKDWDDNDIEEKDDDFDGWKKDKKHKKRHKKFDGHFGGIEIGYASYMDKNQSMSLDTSMKFMELNTGKSFEFNLNIFEQNIKLYKRYIGLTTGMGFRFNQYRFENKNMILNPDAPNFYVVDNQTSYKKNRLATTYLIVPLILEFQVPVGEKERCFFVGVGATGGLKLGSNLKLIDSDGDKNKTKDDFNLNLLTYGLTGRVGFGGINLYANYSLQPMFENNKGPELYPLSVGVSFTGNF